MPRRVLRRLEKSKYADNFVLKGGLFIYTITNFDSRVTFDIDFLLRNIPNAPEKIYEIVEEIINANNTNDFITFEIKKIYPISLKKKYPGIHVDIISRIKNTVTPFSIDFGIGDVIFPKSIKRKIPTQLSNFSIPEIQTYSIETTIAEKIDAILNLMELSSRMKDYYDIWYLANKFDFDGITLTKAIKKTFDNRKRVINISQFEKVISFAKEEIMISMWNSFCKKNNVNIDFIDVLKIIEVFLYNPLNAAFNNDDYNKTWNRETLCWK